MAQIEPEVDSLTLNFSDMTAKVGDSPADRSDVPQRLDLPIDHPHYGRRILGIVPSGSPDMTVDENGDIVPVDENGDIVDTQMLVEVIR